jgi:hypothetical protein
MTNPEAMAASESDDAAERERRGPDPKDRELTGDSLEPPRIIEIPVGLQVLRLPEEIAAAVSQLDKARLRSLAGTRVWLEPLKGRLLLHFGDVDPGTIDP